MTPPRVQLHRKAEAARRKVTTRGKRVPRPRTPNPPARKRGRYRKSGVLSGLSFLLSMGFFAGGSALWAVGACASAAGSAIAWRIEYRRQLAEVKATGQPIGAKAGDPLPAGVTPVDLDNPQPPQRQAQPATRTRKTNAGKHGPPGHEAKCTAKTKEACPYWRKANPGRAKTTTKRASGGARRTK